MRDILFRGKDPDTGKWHVGVYWKYDDATYCFKEDYDCHPENTHHVIIFTEPGDWGLPNKHKQADIDPRTLGQYTGLQDKNGKMVFEGDICKVVYRDMVCSPSYEHYYTEHETVEEVVFYKGAFCFKITIEDIAMYRPIGIDIYEKQEIKCFEVIGNIHEKPRGCKHLDDPNWNKWWCGDCGGYCTNNGCRGPKGRSAKDET